MVSIFYKYYQTQLSALEVVNTNMRGIGVLSVNDQVLLIIGDGQFGGVWCPAVFKLNKADLQVVSQKYKKSISDYSEYIYISNFLNIGSIHYHKKIFNFRFQEIY